MRNLLCARFFPRLKVFHKGGGEGYASVMVMYLWTQNTLPYYLVRSHSTCRRVSAWAAVATGPAAACAAATCARAAVATCAAGACLRRIHREGQHWSMQAAGSSACKTRSQPAARPSCLSVSARPCVQYAARVHAKLAMAKCHDGSLEIWPVTDSTVTWHELSGEEALG